jgi:hypothetical protein
MNLMRQTMKASFLILSSVFGVLLIACPALAVHKIVDDFQVNENVGTSLYRISPDIAGDENGNTVFAWIDSRNDVYDIYFQRYNSSGIAIGKNTRVNTDKGGERFSLNDNETAIAMNAEGQFCICWHFSENPVIHFQRYDADGTPVNGNMSFQPIAGTDVIWNLRITMDAEGNFVIGWWRKYIYLQRFDQNGNLLGEPVCVGSDWYYSPQFDIAMDSQGNLTVVWCDNRNKTFDIFCQRYGDDGRGLGNPFRVNEEENFHQYNPVVAFDAKDNYVIAWVDTRSGYYAIRAQGYDQEGHAKGKNFQVGDKTNNHDQFNPSLSRAASGQFIITWVDQFDNGSYVLSQLFTADGDPSGAILNVTDKKESWTLARGSLVKMDSQGQFLVGWMEVRDGCQGLYYKKYNSNGDLLVPEVKVNDDIGGNPQTLPAIAMDKNGDFTIVWPDYRNGYSRIWCQSYDRRGFSNSDAFRISTGYNVDESRPQIAMVDAGKFAVRWLSYPSSHWDLYSWNLKLCTVHGVTATPILNLAKEEDWWSDDHWNIAGSGNGRFVLVGQPGSYILCQCYDSAGQIVGEKQQVYDAASAFRSPLVTMNGKGEFIVFWQDYQPGGILNLFFQRFDSEGKALGNYPPVLSSPFGRSVAMNDDGYFIIAWEGISGCNCSDIFYQRFDPSGNVLEKNVQVNDLPAGNSVHSPAVSIDAEGNFVIAWGDERNGTGNSDIYCQRYRADGTPVGKNFRVNGDNTTSAQTNPEVAFKNDIIVTTWQTHHNEGQSWDVYANLIQFSDETVVDNNPSDIPASFELLQNHPNPFNAQTMINFVMPAAGKVHLAIYNLLGQEVAVLIDGELTAGQNKIQWDALNIKSGVYVCRLITQRQNLCRKLTVIK